MDLAAEFRDFAQWADDTSPLYARLARDAAADPDVLAVAEHARDGQPTPHLLFAAVHARLLDGAAAPLRAYYPSCTDDARAPDARAGDLFREFVLAHADEIRDTVAWRRTQTNAVRRSAALYPAFARVASETDAPLALVELGSSAGLNLRWDAYRYEYGETVVGRDDAAVTIDAGVRAGDPPLPAAPPAVADRVGVDLNPLDVTDPADVTWLRALVWPEHVDRHALLAAALDDARRNPPPVRAGDVLDELPAVVAALPADATPVVFNTNVLYQFADDARARLRDVLRDLGRERALYWVSGEGKHEDYAHGIQLFVNRVADGEIAESRVGAFQQHGRWVAWTD